MWSTQRPPHLLPPPPTSSHVFTRPSVWTAGFQLSAREHNRWIFDRRLLKRRIFNACLLDWETRQAFGKDEKKSHSLSIRWMWSSVYIYDIPERPCSPIECVLVGGAASLYGWWRGPLMWKAKAVYLHSPSLERRLNEAPQTPHPPSFPWNVLCFFKWGGERMQCVFPH